MNKKLYCFGLVFNFIFLGQIFAQKKQIPSDLLIAGKTPDAFLKALPVVNEWLEPHKVQVFLKTEQDISQKNYVLNLKTNELETYQDKKNDVKKSQKQIIVRNGDIFIKQDDWETRITKDPSVLKRNVTFSPDSMYLAYTKNSNLFTYSLENQRETQISLDGNKTVLNGLATWLYWEEIFGRATAFRAFWWSPDSKKIAYMRFDESKTPMFPIYNSEGTRGYIEETRYPKSGDINPTVKLAITDADGENTVWADFDQNVEHYLGWPKWSLNSEALMVQWINRGNDHLKLFQVSASDAKKKLVYEEKQATWISIDEADERLTLLDGGKEMVIISDQTGWKQLYLYGTDGKLKNQITNGKFTVKEVIGIDQKNRVVYLHARKEHSGRFDLYKVGLDGKNFQRLSFGDFNFRKVVPSPDYNYFTLTYSNLGTPAAVCIIDNKGKVIRELGSAKDENFEAFEINKPEYLTVKSADGKFDLPMTIIYPENMESGKKYPVLVSIYGGPDAGTVYDQWAWTAKNQWLAREGIIQVNFDHRASGHFGKEGVNYMHRNLGYWELEDYKTQVKYLIEKGIADPEKIAITGFSYGGYMSALAVCKASDVFTHAMAGGSVTSWELYDSAYTERFMDKPDENPDGYKNGSVLAYTAAYKGKLLLVHGTMDDNVHLQNSIQLVNDLQEKKKDFEMMFYPGGKHGWGGNKGIHYENLKTKFIYRYLLEKPVPDGLLK
jgi:dipeptidyl-peptidase 4